MTLKAKMKRALRRGESGQAILLLAVGFVILLGFVGVVTDLSLLFVRFTALRRAVDSAAVAAAGQYSRTESDAVNLQKTTFAARQFLEFHGVDPGTIIVRTCQSIPQPVDSSEPTEDSWETVEGWNNITDEMLENAEAASQDMSLSEAERETAAERLSYLTALQETAENVCDPEERNGEIIPSGRKLVQVEAGITVPTTFMSLFGQDDFYLTASAVSETASLDVIIVLDVSESMLYETTYDDYNELLLDPLTERKGDGVTRQFIRYDAPNRISDVQDRLDFLQNYTPGDYIALSDPDSDGYSDPVPYTTTDGTDLDIAYDRYVTSDGTSDGARTYIDANDTGGGSNAAIPGGTEVYELRPECRVRIRPSPNTEFQEAIDFYHCCNDPLANATLNIEDDRYTGEIVVQEGSLGTPNDPGSFANGSAALGGDNNFQDLVCQPFKQARDASLDFLYNIDFLAGDRVGFVTFDRGATIIDPDGDEGGLSPMISDRCVAINVLTRLIGVRTEPNFYHRDGTLVKICNESAEIMPWTDFSSGVDSDGNSIPVKYFDDPEVEDDVSFENSAVGSWTDKYFVRDSCAYDNVALGDRHSIWSGTNTDLGDDEPGPLAGVAVRPDNLFGNAWRETLDPVFFTDPDERPFPNQYIGFATYERNAQCRGTNFGAALRNANNALTDSDTIRRDGTVWVIVLLSDGAAGATDPVPQTPGGTLDLPAPYERADGTRNPASPPAPDAGTYGAFGFCPNGTPSDPTGYAIGNIAAELCSDDDPRPEDRNACLTDFDDDPNAKDLSGEIEGVIDQYYDASDCAGYNADDYARDWADFVARNRPGQTDLQLPTIYTIGFNLTYPEGNTLSANDNDDNPDVNNLCEGNMASCMGESLLRYIADVGDNGEYDGDYPEAWDDTRFAEVSYGNYWNAPDEEELRDVFDEIASKLFIRITG